MNFANVVTSFFYHSSMLYLLLSFLALKLMIFHLFYFFFLFFVFLVFISTCESRLEKIWYRHMVKESPSSE